MPTTPEPENSRTVPYARFSEVKQQAKDLDAKVATLTTENTTLKSKADELDAVKAAHAADKAAWADERGLVAAGITDPEGQEVARLLYGKLQNEGKPKDIQSYIAGLRTEGAAVPKPLQPYLQPAAVAGGMGAGGGGNAAGAGGSPTFTPPAKTTPNPAGDGTSPGNAGAPTAAELRVLREEAQRTNDWTKWKAAAARAQLPTIRRGP